MQGYRITTDQSEMNFDFVYDFISTSYWAKGIPRDTFDKSVSNSVCFGVLDANNQQVGFARLITDTATFAYLSDVFITEKERGKGLSKLLVDFILNQPETQGLRRIMLGTADAHGLYQQFGFKPLQQPEMLMQIWQPDPYQTEA